MDDDYLSKEELGIVEVISDRKNGDIFYSPIKDGVKFVINKGNVFLKKENGYFSFYGCGVKKRFLKHSCEEYRKGVVFCSCSLKRRHSDGKYRVDGSHGPLCKILANLKKKKKKKKKRKKKKQERDFEDNLRKMKNNSRNVDRYSYSSNNIVSRYNSIFETMDMDRSMCGSGYSVAYIFQKPILIHKIHVQRRHRSPEGNWVSLFIEFPKEKIENISSLSVRIVLKKELNLFERRKVNNCSSFDVNPIMAPLQEIIVFNAENPNIILSRVNEKIYIDCSLRVDFIVPYCFNREGFRDIIVSFKSIKESVIKKKGLYITEHAICSEKNLPNRSEVHFRQRQYQDYQYNMDDEITKNDRFDLMEDEDADVLDTVNQKFGNRSRREENLFDNGETFEKLMGEYDRNGFDRNYKARMELDEIPKMEETGTLFQFRRMDNM